MKTKRLTRNARNPQLRRLKPVVAPPPPSAPAPRRFTLPPEAFDAERTRLLRGFYAAFLLVLVAAALLALRNVDFNSTGARMLWSIKVITVCVAFSLSVGFWGIFRSLRLRRREWETYELLLGDDCIIRKQFDRPDLQLGRADIVQVQETAGRGLMINSGETGRYIFVPASLHGYAELKSELARWLPPAPPRSRELLWRSPFFIGTVCLASWSILYLSDNKHLVAGAAFVLMSFLLGTYITALLSANVSRTLRRGAWVYLVVAFVALLRVYQVFTPHDH
jgi:hypothetical protein